MRCVSRFVFSCLVTVLLTVFALGVPTAHAQPPAIKILRVRLVPFTLPKHEPTQMVLIDWKNVGKEPVREVRASLHFLDARGRPVASTPGVTPDVIDTAIFEDYAHPIRPGATYREPNGQGYALIVYPGAKKAARAHVTITAAIAAN